MTADSNTPDLNFELGQFEERCNQARQALERRAARLNPRGFKRWLRRKAPRTAIQQALQQVAQDLADLAQAAQIARALGQRAALCAVATHIKQLRIDKDTLQTRLPPVPKISVFDYASVVLAPAVAAVWEGLFKLGFFAQAPTWVMGALMSTGVMLLLKTAVQQLYIRLCQDKIVDEVALIKQLDDIIHQFEKMEGKMYALDNQKLLDNNQELLNNNRELLNNNREFRDMVEKSMSLLTRELAQIKNENSEIKETNSQLQRTIEKLLEVIGKKDA